MYYRAALMIITRKTVNVSYLKQLKWKLGQNVFFCPRLLYVEVLLFTREGNTSYVQQT